MPLPAVTAWELLFARLQVESEATAHEQQIPIIGGAGGVGSILLQLACKPTNLKIIGTASRPQSADWVRQLAAHEIIDHTKRSRENSHASVLPQ